LHAADESGGLFAPTVLNPLRSAGYDRSFELLAQTNGDTSVAIQPKWGWQRVRLDKPGGRVELAPDIGIDLGGIAKGWTVDLVAAALAQHGPVLVDAGGDIRAIGAPGDEPWPVAVQDPFDEKRDRAVLALRHGGVATSSIGRRRWQQHGQMMHHLIDPRTGAASESDLHTVTVLANTAEEADVAAKVVLLMGARDGAGYLTDRGLAGMLFDRYGNEQIVGELPSYDFTEAL
jgi:thiamine biosynthesis lipoprotein